MPKEQTQYEPFAWWLTRERIGEDLRKRYPEPQELPRRLLTLTRKLDDAVEGDQFREELSPATPSLLSKLDAVEGNQLLRACRTRLRALCCLQRFGSFT
jgi:hypothetical protein